MSESTKVPLFTMFLPITPVPKGRPRFTSRGQRYTPPETRKAEADVKALLMTRRPSEPILGPLSVEIHFYLVAPKYRPKSRHYPSVRPDIDNLAKLILDCLQPEILHDDSQVVTLLTSKSYAQEPGVQIQISKKEPPP